MSRKSVFENIGTVFFFFSSLETVQEPESHEQSLTVKKMNLFFPLYSYLHNGEF